MSPVQTAFPPPTAQAPDVPPEVRRQLRRLSHYMPDYIYRPDRYEYTEHYTTDPYYIVEGVVIPSSPADSKAQRTLANGLEILSAQREETASRHAVNKVAIMDIPTVFFRDDPNPDRIHNPNPDRLAPDVSFWDFPLTERSHRYDPERGPLLVMEVVSPDSVNNDWMTKVQVYARMGIREYWVLDETREPAFHGFTLDPAAWEEAPRMEYRPIVAGQEGGLYSGVLDVTLRWHEDGLQCWHEPWEQWIRIADIPPRGSTDGGTDGGAGRGGLKGNTGRLSTKCRCLDQIVRLRKMVPET